MKKIDTYLSVDLDYWGTYKRLNKKNTNTFIDKCISIEAPIQIVVSHEKILKHINKYKISNLINIDYHADIGDESYRMDLNEGTWANFYKYKKDCNFIWRRPMPEYDMHNGRCDLYYKSNWEEITTGYKQITSIYSTRGIEWNSVEEICFCISPEYLCVNMSWLADRYAIFAKYKHLLTNK